MSQIHVSRPTAFGDICAQVDLGIDSTAGIQLVANLQQGQLGDMNAGGMRESQQHHITLRHAASDRGYADQVFELSKT